jgi:hypothetical protein
MKTSAYAPLQGSRSIRLLSLSPSRRATAKIRCTIEEVSLDDNPDYEALSWEWGDAIDTETILLNGLQHNVPKNLTEALRQYRLDDQPRLLWVDAVCINQADLHERSLQICLMREIYRQATVVQVWLGPMRRKEELDVFPIFEEMARGLSIRQLYHQQVVGRVAPPISPEDFEETYMPEHWDTVKSGYDSDFFGKLFRFFDLGWWERLWVLQEVVVARTVLLRWGIKTIALTTLFSAHDSIRADLQEYYHVTAGTFGERVVAGYLNIVAERLELIQYLQILQSATENVDQNLREQQVYCLLIEILALCRTREASDPRDKIYGLLRLLPREVSLQIQPSYSQPEKLVFVDLACLILRMTRSFMLFSCLSREDDTWIPSSIGPTTTLSTLTRA